MPMSPRLLRPRQTIHPEAADWANRVRTNGGSVSGTTLTAVDRFVKAIHRAGIRDRFFRLNLFCGNSDANLAAVRTPLFRGPSLTATQFGNATDTNLNFGPGDYAETGASGGLLGNGSSKYLATGLVPSSVLTRGDTHLSVHVVAAPTSGAFIPAIGAFEGSGQTSLIISHNAATLASPFGYEDFNSVNGYVSGSQNNPVGHLLGSSVSAADRRAFRNGTQSGSTGQASMTGALTANQVFVFSRNLNGAANLFSNARLAGYSIGAGMTAAQVLSFSAAMLAFQSALGRPTT